jgi:MscS family membrane protein
VTRQRRLEAVDKLMSVLTLVVAAVFGVQALGLDVNSGGRRWAHVEGWHGLGDRSG